MYDFIRGKLVEKTPTHAVIDCQGVGYHLNISLHTYSRLPSEGECRLFVHQIVREDAISLFGFMDQDERTLFRYLITVQGVGANTARMILGAMSPPVIVSAIHRGASGEFQAVKGIGAKTAQKIILELKDKLGKEAGQGQIPVISDNTPGREALSALIQLGFPRNQAEKAVQLVLKQGGNAVSLEDLIKSALKIM
ncbi:MAG TPA: Holliday junction branch migration protein RuvA [Bacteroidales bacterium]|nr:Holliday junction branch migration protein RuvA [Bacteroidales bacterium]HSA43953.1 Holliday junction branch migration protein RuvA [Bacteroidales bacterium]